MDISIEFKVCVRSTHTQTNKQTSTHTHTHKHTHVLIDPDDYCYYKMLLNNPGWIEIKLKSLSFHTALVFQPAISLHEDLHRNLISQLTIILILERDWSVGDT